MSDFPKLAKLIFEGNDTEQIFATIGFRIVLWHEENSVIQSVIDMNLVPKFLSLLERPEPYFQVSDLVHE